MYKSRPVSHEAADYPKVLFGTEALQWTQRSDSEAMLKSQNYTAANPYTGQAYRVDTDCKSGLKDWMECGAFLFFVYVGGFSIIEVCMKTGQEESDWMI